MSNFIDNFIEKNRPQIIKYRNYLITQDWSKIKTYTPPVVVEDTDNKKKKTKKKDDDGGYSFLINELNNRKEEAKLQANLLNTIADKLIYFSTEAKEDAHLQKYKKFVKEGIDIIKIHIDRADTYNDAVDIALISYSSLRSEEIELQNELFKQTANLQKKISSLNFNENEEEYDNAKVTFYKEDVAPLILREPLTLLNDVVKERVEKIPVDWSLRTSKEMFINMKPSDIPKWNNKKHFFDQDPVVLQFWAEEINKIEKGVTIGGYFIHPWLYFHLNFFRTPIPQLNGKEPVIQPDLRDNEWFFAENLKKCIHPENENYYAKAILMYGTRRFGKSVILASLAHWRTITKFNSFGTIIGGSSSDLGALTSKVKSSMTYIEEPLRLKTIQQEWDNGETTFGIKEDASNPIVYSTLVVQNLEAGAKSKSQKTAGLAPSVSIYDEIGKYAFLKAYLAALPSFKTPFGFKCITVLAGTGGEADLSKDAVDVLSNPEVYDLLPMDWDLLENVIDPEFITWKRRKFATFFPGQMAYEDGFIKKEQKFSDFLKVEDEELAKISIHVSDWQKNGEYLKSKIVETENVGGSKGKLLEQQRKVQFPLDPEDCFMSSEENKFPAIEAKRRKDFLLSEGDGGKKVYLTQDEKGAIGFDLTNKPLAEYPHGGGFIDAPVVLYEDLPQNKPVDYLYLAGFDDYKQDESGTDSVGSMHIYKVNIGTDKWCGRIVASIASRPDPHSKLYRQMFLLMQAYNAKCFMENADMGFKDYLDKKRQTDFWLIESMDFKSDMSQKSHGRRRFGWTPTKENIAYLKSQAIAYANAEHTVINEKGEEEVVLGVDLINDIGLLDEMITYRPDNNVDRITSFMSCLGYENYLFQNYMLPTVDRRKKKEEEKKPQKNERNLAERMFGVSTKPPKYF